MTPPPSATFPVAAAPHALSTNHSTNSAIQTKTRDDDGRHAFHALCMEQQRLVARFLALEKPNKPEMTTETLQRAQAQTRRSLAVLKEALKRFQLDALSLSYNGGKDCLVLLVLYMAALTDTFSAPNSVSEHSETSLPSNSHTNHTTSSPNDRHTSPPPSSLPSALAAVYIEAPHPFPELTSFVELSGEAYRLALVRHSGEAGLRAAFAAYCAEQPGVEAILVGTRRSDPHGAHLADFQPTDSGWPKFVRVLPMLEWHYEEIWAFLRALDIPYCELYDQGYTSLGGTNDTRPNPALRRGEDAVGAETFKPAYELIGDAEERLGRDH